MPIIENRFQFEPNAKAREAWLGTRKSVRKHGNQRLPGLFQTVKYPTDIAWVTLTITLEACAIVLSIIDLLVVSFIPILFLVILGFIGAYFVHKPATNRQYLMNLKVDNRQVERYRQKLLEDRTYQIFGVIIIILSALSKFSIILLLGNFNIVIYVIIAIFYCFVIYTHLSHTGYFLSEWNTGRLFNKQYNQWLKGDEHYDSRTLRSPFESPIQLANMQNLQDKITVGCHNITFTGTRTENNITYTGIRSENENTNILFLYQLTTKGILQDDDINLFLCGQNQQQSGIIALACLDHQINIIHN
jgi:multisubunit Na+/H+ antiporter MnhG subunit